MKVKSFKGKLADGEEKKIRLSTNRGLTGYKIKKFQLMTSLPGAGSDYASTVKLLTQTLNGSAPDSVVDFDSDLILAVAFLSGDSATPNNYLESIIFDNVTFNQDIFISHNDTYSNQAVNYYIELEQMKLDVNESTVATLKDMRAGPDTNFSP